MKSKHHEAPALPPVDPEALAEAARRMMRVKKPASGWPTPPPAEDEQEKKRPGSR